MRTGAKALRGGVQHKASRPTDHLSAVAVYFYRIHKCRSAAWRNKPALCRGPEAVGGQKRAVAFQAVVNSRDDTKLSYTLTLESRFELKLINFHAYWRYLRLTGSRLERLRNNQSAEVRSTPLLEFVIPRPYN
jgi:hypothetical protein